jgi:hypothetical protein
VTLKTALEPAETVRENGPAMMLGAAGNTLNNAGVLVIDPAELETSTL